MKFNKHNKPVLAGIFIVGIGALLWAAIATGALTGFVVDRTLIVPNSTSAYGIVSQPTFKDETGNHGSNLHSELAAVYANLTLTTIHATDEAGVLIPTYAAVGTTTTNAYGIKATAPTAATNNYSGRFIGGEFNVDTYKIRFPSLAASATGRLFLCIDGQGFVTSRATTCNP